MSNTIKPFWDQSALSDLKKLSQQTDPDVKKKTAEDAAKQFEAIFMQQILKATRNPVYGENTLFNNTGDEQFKSMLHDQLSVQASQGKGLGLAKQISDQILKMDSFSGKKSVLPKEQPNSESGI